MPPIKNAKLNLWSAPMKNTRNEVMCNLRRDPILYNFALTLISFMFKMEILRKMANGFRIKRLSIGICFSLSHLLLVAIFLDKPYQIATNLGIPEIRFQIGIRIENFPSFVVSKAQYYTDGIIVNNSKWFINLCLMKYCHNDEEYITVTSSSNDQPEKLGAFIFGRRRDRKDSSFIVYATLKFKQPPTAEGFRILGRKLNLSKTNCYRSCIFFDEMAINVNNFPLLLHL